jgi:hypothetical protein
MTEPDRRRRARAGKTKKEHDRQGTPGDGSDDACDSNAFATAPSLKEAQDRPGENHDEEDGGNLE